MEVRDLGFLEWRDPLAWMEPMKGDRWKKTVAAEKEHFVRSAKTLINEAELNTIYKELLYSRRADLQQPLILYSHVAVVMDGSYFLEWKWLCTEHRISAINLTADVDGNVWDICESAIGDQKDTLRYWKKGATKPTWTHTGVSDDLYVMGDLCYFFEVDKDLWKCRLVSVHAKTGKGRKVLYEEKDEMWNLSIQWGEAHTAYLLRSNAGLSEAFHILQNTLKPIKGQGSFLFGKGDNYLLTEGRGTDSWVAHGSQLSRWKLPTKGAPESLWIEKGLLITINYGERTLWHCSSTHAPKKILQGFFQLIFNKWCQHYSGEARIICIEPGSPKKLLFFDGHQVQMPLITPYAGVQRFFTPSHVPYFLVKGESAPKGLFIYGYGAYGIETMLSTTMWYPLLVRGWAIVFALIRGGGDHTNQYAEAARTYNRERSIRDFQDVIRDVQRRTKISPADTVIYGRSAGGILVGTSAHLVGAVYAEVPYVDVLRTSTNPRLPLTKLEYNEFGNPRERLEDFAATLKTSPVDLVPEEGYPNLFALVRTGENDKEVFAYEPIKWIHKLRGRDKKDPTKLLAFGDHEGHFVRGDLAIQHRAVDLAILLGWKRSA